MKNKLFVSIIIFFFVFQLQGGNIDMADYNIQMGQRNGTNTEWDNHFPITKVENVKMQDGSGLDSQLAQSQTQISNLEANKAEKVEINTLATEKANLIELNVERERINNLIATSSSSFYEKCLSTDTGSLLIVDTGATTGQINIASVTPVATGYTPIVGDYVRLVYGVSSGSAELLDVRIGVDGQTYSTVGSSVRNQILDIDNSISKKYVSLAFTNGYYINAINQTLSTNASYMVSPPILVKKNETISVKTGGTASTISIITLVKENGEIINPLVIADVSTIKTYSYKPNRDVYVIVSSRISDYKFISIESLQKNILDNKEALNSLVNCEPLSPNITKGYYYTPDGILASNSGYFITPPISLLEGEVIQFYARGTSTNVSLISEVDENGSFVQALLRSQDSNPNVFTYKAPKDIKVVLSCALDVNYYINKITFPNVFFENRVIEKVDYSIMFENAVFIGDSITEGYYGDYPTGERLRAYTYPLAVGRLTKWNVTNLGKSGSNATTWWASHSTTDFSNYDVAFIMFGRNNSFETEDDIQNYKSVINKLRTDNENMTIFLLSVAPAINNNEIPINEVIKQIAIDESLPYLDIFTNSKMSVTKSDLYRPGDGVHFNKIGYTNLAHDVVEAMNDYIEENLIEFRDMYVPPKV